LLTQLLLIFALVPPLFWVTKGWLVTGLNTLLSMISYTSVLPQIPLKLALIRLACHILSEARQFVSI